MQKRDPFQFDQLDLAWYKLGKGTPLLILHGWGSNSNVMLPLAQSLSDIRTVYLLDLPGFGESDTPITGWDLDNYTDCVTQFIEEVIQGKTDMLVHSFGGRILLKLCARKNHPKLGKLLITGGAGMKPKRSFSFYFKKYLTKSIKAPTYLLPFSLREKALNRIRTTQLWKSLGSGDYRQLTGAMRETFVKTVTEHLEKCLPDIDEELFLLWGKEDLATPIYQAERIVKLTKRSSLVTIENAGHYAFLDQSSTFISIARAYYTG